MDFYLIPIIIGLGLDVIGALMIIGPIREYKKIKSNYEDEGKRLDEDVTELTSGKFDPTSPEQNYDRIELIEEKLRDMDWDKEHEYPQIYSGVILLVIGFILQAVGAGWQLINSIE